MRLHFISRLALLLAASFLVVASQVWTGGTLEWLFIVGGAVMIALAAAGTTGTNAQQRALDGFLGLFGAWSVVEAIVFDGSTLKWFSFGTAIVAAALAVAGLLIHELTTERVVHELSVTNRGETPSRTASLAS
jgi:hypothetical protein